MFGKSNATPSYGSNTTTFIAQDCEISGTININGNARIDGKVEGAIICSGDLTIGGSANLVANIEAKTVSIAGEIKGDIKTSEYLELSPSAKLYGDIYTKQLKIDQGAVFIGTSHQSQEAIVIRPDSMSSPKNSSPKTESERPENDEENPRNSRKEKRNR